MTVLALILDIVSAVLIVLGILVMAAAVYGVFHIRYVLNRMHASAMIDSLGLLLILAGVALQYGISLPVLKVCFIVALFWCASPVCAHVLMDLETDTNENLRAHCESLPLSVLKKEEARRAAERKEREEEKA